ncbi:beta-L-arabinofuranosidase domain-containing protein [Promicromonospora sp. MEB111]|uniref:beta-L-arabinofuranosidase domain-containing protein n=1 Tax=Promicromonospora sp. MEB111 TaxID=3040301 RepID=UPI00254B55E7|nr:beta-L-arabinofuranosidase domain-containing protein [Promicromonospora sp. MEB111]
MPEAVLAAGRAVGGLLAPGTRVAEPFPLADVVLTGGVFTRARDQMLHLARVYPVDRLLAVFRANAGLDTRGALPPGGWEDFGHPDEDAWGPDDYPGREAAPTANLLRGHYAGHFLSMLSLAAGGADDAVVRAELRAKVDDLVEGLREVQETLAATGRYSHPGFLAAYGEWQFSRLEGLAPYGEIWAPYYTCHKIMAGLLDAHRHTGSATALDVAAAMGRWVHGRLSVLPAEQRAQMWALYIAGEAGGMNEVLCDLAVLTGDEVFVEAARLFDLDTLLDLAAAGRDELDGMHANQHAATLLGYLALADLTGENRYLDAVVNLWDMVVPGRTYAHGGSGENELWGPAGAVAGDIGNRNAETCVTYNMLKIARALFERTGEARFADYYERAVTNQVLGSRRDVGSDDSPEVTYMFPVHPGALREYDNVGTCCGGTGLENHVKYQDSVYFRSPAGVSGSAGSPGSAGGAPAGAADGDVRTVWVNLYVASTASWPEAGVRLVQETAYPLEGASRIRVDATGDLELRLRVPGWVGGSPVSDPQVTGGNHRSDTGVPGFSVRVDGEVQSVRADGGYVSLRRDWRPGTVVEIDMPLTLREVPAPDDTSVVSLELGPTVLLARSAATTWLPVEAATWRRLDGTLDAPLTSADDGTWRLGDLVLEPTWSGSDARYHMYLRRADARIAFAGTDPAADSGVPNPARQDGRTFLDVLWSDGGFADRSAFVEAVLSATHEFVDLGLLSATEARQVLVAAARSDVGREADGAAGRLSDGDGGPGSDGDPRSADEAALLSRAPTPTHEGSAPRVEIVAAAAPGVTGWYLRPAELTVSTRADVGEPAVEVRVGDEPWRPAGQAPLVLSDGVHTVTARAVDEAGRERRVVREVSVDTRPPRTTVTTKRLGPRGVEINLAAADDVSGVDSIRWKGPDTFWATFAEPFSRALSDVPQVIEFAATDRAGNQEPVRTLVLPPADADR